MTYSPIYIHMPEWIELIEKQGTFKVNTIMEIGSMDGADAAYLAEHFKPDTTIIIEAHPEFAVEIAKQYDEYDVYSFVAGNRNTDVIFNAVSKESHNLGMSSMLEREDKYPSHETEYMPIEVQSMRMDEFCSLNGIDEIDVLKIDVEGNSYEVLEGFGDMLWNVKCIHIECEHESVWKDQATYCYVENYLLSRGFIPIAIKIGYPQSDSVWIKKEFLNDKWHLV